MDANRLTKRPLKGIAAAFVVVAFGYAGRMDFEEEVVRTMSDEQYHYIKDELGGKASMSEVVDEYLSKQDYYDSIESERNYGTTE